MDSRDIKIKELEGTVLTQLILLESLVEILYRNELITKKEFSEIVETKIKSLNAANLNKSKKKGRGDDSSNSIFYGPPGEA